MTKTQDKKSLKVDAWQKRTTQNAGGNRSGGKSSDKLIFNPTIVTHPTL